MFNLAEEGDPRYVPSYQFYGNLNLDFDSAVRADTTKQNYSVMPRCWYIDATFRCCRCNNTFIFTAKEQKFWYEDLGFYVDSRAIRCPECRGEVRRLKELQQEYDRDIAEAIRSGDVEFKKHVVSIIDAMNAVGAHLPDRMTENRSTLEKQILRIK